MRLPMQSTTCRHCGNQFKVKASVLARGNGKYCSKACEVAGRPSRSVPLAMRFWKYVQKTDYCWLWTGSRDAREYGRINKDKSPVLAHRVSWELHFGPIPDGANVLHRCDNPPCCNPDHLFLGNQSVNMQDCAEKDRKPHGERTTYHKLTETEVREIRSRYAVGDISQTELATTYGIAQSTVTEIIRGVIWNRSFDESKIPAKRRRTRGESIAQSKLTETAVIQIRVDAANGVSQLELAAKYGVSRRNINRIVNGVIWKHLL